MRSYTLFMQESHKTGALRLTLSCLFVRRMVCAAYPIYTRSLEKTGVSTAPMRSQAGRENLQGHRDEHEDTWYPDSVPTIAQTNSQWFTPTDSDVTGSGKLTSTT